MTIEHCPLDRCSGPAVKRTASPPAQIHLADNANRVFGDRRMSPEAAGRVDRGLQGRGEGGTMRAAT